MAIPINIEELIHGRVVESERIEFKTSFLPVPIMHSICAFANDIHNWGGGYVIIGIEEQDGKPLLPSKGLSLEEIDSIQKKLLEQCKRLQPHYFPIVSPAVYQKRSLLPDTQCVYFRPKSTLSKLDTQSIDNQRLIITQHSKSMKNEHPEIHIDLILRLCEQRPHSKQELAEKLSLHQKHIYKRYIKSLMQEGLIKQTNPNPRASNQKYITTHRT